MHRAFLPVPLNVRIDRGRRAFTLVELMVVILIIGILAGIVVVNTQFAGDEARRSAAEMQVRTLGDAVDQYWVRMTRLGRERALPRTLDELITGPDDWAGTWSGPLRTDHIPDDPWGRPYVYTVDDTTGRFEVRSLGADGRRGGSAYDADIVYPLTIDADSR